METPKVSGTRQQMAAILLKLLAVVFGLPAVPFIVEGFENLVMGGLLWLLACFAMAAFPIAVSVGLWRRRRWVRTAALWVSVLAVPLLPLLTIAYAILSYSAGFTTIVLALFLGSFAALIVYFLTSPETKAIFGVSSENASQRRPMIPRAVLGKVILAALAIVSAVGAVCIVSHAVKLRRQPAIAEQVNESNERIAGELKPLIEAELRSMDAGVFVSSHCGVFESLDQVRFERMTFPTGASRNELNGIAHFEKADLDLNVHVSFAKTPEGQTRVELRFWPDETWLKEHPQARLRVVDRRLVVSADSSRQHARGGMKSEAAVIGGFGSGHIGGTVDHLHDPLLD